MQEEKFVSGFIAIIGRPNVGKSTLLNRILGQKVAITSNKPQTTRNRILGIHNFSAGQALFVDTPGIHKAKGKLNRFMVDQAIGACADVDLILFLVEADDSPGGGDEYILKLLDRSSVPVFLIINKIDLVKPPKLLKLIQQYSERFKFAEVIPLSARGGDGVPQLLQAIEPLLPEGPRYYPEDMLTDQPERFIVAELVREKIMRRTSEEIPYGVGVQVESFEEKPEKPKSTLVSTGCYLFPKEVLEKISEYLSEGNNRDAPGHFVKWLSENTDVFGFKFEGKWFDIGSFESLQEANEYYSRKVI